MNDMRKLMEAVSPLFEDWDEGLVGFKSIKVGANADDVAVGGKLITPLVIWVYDDSSAFGRQTSFSRDLGDGVTDEEYNEILKAAVWQVQDAIEQAHNEKDWVDEKKPRFNHVALGADVSPDIDKELVNDIIKQTSLSDLPSTLSDDGDYVVFEIAHPKKKRFWQR